MTDYPTARHSAQLLAAVAEPTRLHILNHLAIRPYFVGELAKLLKLPLMNLSHHLGVMRQAGILDDTKDGRFVVYAIKPELFKPSRKEGELGTLTLGQISFTLRGNRPAKAKQ